MGMGIDGNCGREVVEDSEGLSERSQGIERERTKMPRPAAGDTARVSLAERDISLLMANKRVSTEPGR